MQKGLKLKWLLIVSLINAFGMGFLWPLVSIYIHDELHQNMTMVGVILLINSLGQVVGSLISGHLFDKWRPITIIRIGIIALIGIMTLLVFFHGWPSFPILLAIDGLMVGWMTAIINAFGTAVIGHDGRKVFNLLYFTANFGMVFATALVGAVYGFGVTWLFIIALAMYVIIFFIINRHFDVEVNVDEAEEEEEIDKPNNFKLPIANKMIISAILIGLVGIWIAYAQWNGNVSVYFNSILKLPLWQYSMLWTINGGLVVVFQLVMNAFHLIGNKRVMWIQIFAGLTLFIGAYYLLSLSRVFPMFVIAMIVTTLGEVMVFPMLPALVNDLTPAHSKGHYQGLVTAAPSLGRAVGPLFGGYMVDQLGYMPMFNTTTVIVAISAVIIVGMIIVYRKRIVKFD
ncbi:MAG: MFS transporter [Lactobacillaceae bacterium]|jgi:MFS family permease|nr:MFS transporter [Lactobacillaceae bacterium]